MTEVDLCPVDHKTVKDDLDAFGKLTLVDVQEIDFGDGGESTYLEHRNCLCNTTLSRTCTQAEHDEILIKHADEIAAHRLRRELVKRELRQMRGPVMP